MLNGFRLLCDKLEALVESGLGGGGIKEKGVGWMVAWVAGVGRWGGVGWGCMGWVGKWEGGWEGCWMDG